VAVQYGTDPALATFTQTIAVQTTSAGDFTALVPLTGLQAQTTYYYRVLVNGVAQQAGPLPSFTTFPAPGSAQDFTFAVVSDLQTVSKYPDLPAPAYDQILAEDPAFVLQTGDFDHRNPQSLGAFRLMDRQVRGAYGTGSVGAAGYQF